MNTEYKYPTEVLKNRYVPIDDISKHVDISKKSVKRYIKAGRVRIAEFTIPGDKVRSLHVNIDDIDKCIEEDQCK